MPFLFWLPMIVMSGMWNVARDGDRKPPTVDATVPVKPVASADRPAS